MFIARSYKSSFLNPFPETVDINGSATMDATADYAYVGPEGGNNLGWSVAFAGDFGGESNVFIVAGSPGHNTDGADQGKVEVLSFVVISEFSSLLIVIGTILISSIFINQRKRWQTSKQ